MNIDFTLCAKPLDLKLCKKCLRNCNRYKNINYEWQSWTSPEPRINKKDGKCGIEGKCFEEIPEPPSFWSKVSEWLKP